MSKTVKKVGSLNLKTMIEEDKLLINDYEIISELTTFIQKNNSFEAEDGCNDDLAMCLVIYAWLVAQDYFKELTDQDVEKEFMKSKRIRLNKTCLPLDLFLMVLMKIVLLIIMVTVGMLMNMVIDLICGTICNGTRRPI